MKTKQITKKKIIFLAHTGILFSNTAILFQNTAMLLRNNAILFHNTPVLLSCPIMQKETVPLCNTITRWNRSYSDLRLP